MDHLWYVWWIDTKCFVWKLSKLLRIAAVKLLYISNKILCIDVSKCFRKCKFCFQILIFLFFGYECESAPTYMNLDRYIVSFMKFSINICKSVEPSSHSLIWPKISLLAINKLYLLFFHIYVFLWIKENMKKMSEFEWESKK